MSARLRTNLGVSAACAYVAAEINESGCGVSNHPQSPVALPSAFHLVAARRVDGLSSPPLVGTAPLGQGALVVDEFRCVAD
jgi:hypothetical protein